VGATAGDIVALAVGRGLRWVLVGLAGGVATALGLAKLASSLLFGVTAVDPGHFATAALLLGGGAAVALYLPARRASRIEPLAAIREE